MPSTAKSSIILAQDRPVALDFLALPYQAADPLKQIDVDADDAALEASDNFFQPRAQALAARKEQAARDIAHRGSDPR